MTEYRDGKTLHSILDDIREGAFMKQPPLTLKYFSIGKTVQVSIPLPELSLVDQQQLLLDLLHVTGVWQQLINRGILGEFDNAFMAAVLAANGDPHGKNL